jgi:outer membrane protein assembly factor BamA
VAYAPETSWEFGLSSLFVYRANQDTLNRLSEMQGFAFLTLEQQYGSWLEHTLYTDKNKYFFLGQAKFQNFPLSYHGIGMNTPDEKIALVSTNEIRIRERVLRQIVPSLYTGFEVNYERLTKVGFETPDQVPITLPLGWEGSTNLSLGWGVVYDDIHNVLNPRHGHFGEVAFLSSRKAWGSTFDFNLAFADFRYYTPIKKNNVLAIQAYGQFGSGNIPFNELALMGGERIMRGYYLGRYRDNNYTAAQVEYRMLPFSFAKRWGASFFASAGTVYSDFKSFTNSSLAWSLGGGPRFLLFPKKDVYNRIDFAVTPEGTGIYFFIGEAF